jgi:hypothetical protein
VLQIFLLASENLFLSQKTTNHGTLPSKILGVSTAACLVLELQSSFLEGALRALQRFRQADFSCIRPYCPAKICERKDDISNCHTFVAVGIDIVPLAVLGQRDDNDPTQRKTNSLCLIIG